MTPPKPPASPRAQLRGLPTWLHVSDIQGLAQLATQATLGVTGLAETVQGSVYKSIAAPLGGLGARFVDTSPGATGVKPRGITGIVYGGIKGITRLAGGTVNTLLDGAASLAGEKKSSPPREAMLAVINGVLGDRLLDTANPLTITMSLRTGGEALPLAKQPLKARLPGATGRILVMVHGLCMNDLQWDADGLGGHGAMLARELGYTPVDVHYNTGLHTSVNGQQLSAWLQQLVEAWPQPVEEISLLTHSMGGLVARSACRSGELAGDSWRKLLKSLVFLGTPHQGAPLEMLGNWVDVALGSNVVTKPFARIGQIRSAGITDLRYGNVQDADWQDADRFERAPDAREPLPLPEGVACFAVAATTLSEPVGGLVSLKAQLANQLVGDGLVPLPSALGEHADGSRALAFAPGHQYIAWSTGHLALLGSADVGQKLRGWLAA